LSTKTDGNVIPLTEEVYKSSRFKETQPYQTVMDYTYETGNCQTVNFIPVGDLRLDMRRRVKGKICIEGDESDEHRL